jgi:hypothetical protein
LRMESRQGENGVVEVKFECDGYKDK